MKILHLIYTRFNLQLAEKLEVLKIKEGWDLGPPDAWMDHRIPLFEKYCFSSIVNQTNQNFIWFILCDSGTKEPYKETLLKFKRSNIIISLQPVDPFALDMDAPGWGAVRKKTNELFSDHDVLLTTRLDNDDALHKDYVNVMQTTMLDVFKKNPHEQWLVNMINGYKYKHASGELYSTEMKNCQFQTMIETIKPARTILGLGNHSTAHERCETGQFAHAPLWMQIIHEKNIYNRVKPKDKKVNTSELEDNFVFA